MKTTKRSALLSPRGRVSFAVIILLCLQLASGLHGKTQNPKSKQDPSGERSDTAEEGDIVERAVAIVCTERAQDPEGSIPIDEMAAQPALPLTDSRVSAGRKRAERLLSSAKKLVPQALFQLAASYNLEPLSRDWIKMRVNAVHEIKVEIDHHDNASWEPGEPRAIIFGPVFLAGLRSDEAMIAVLAHELTHAVDGADGALRPLIMRLRTRASQEGGLPIQEASSVELTCEMVGISVMQEYISHTPAAVTARQRLTRALGKNCVHLDLADETHLSPLKTMRLLLILEPDLTRAIVRDEEGRGRKKKVNHYALEVHTFRR
jgi:hypothetical protein